MEPIREFDVGYACSPVNEGKMTDKPAIDILNDILESLIDSRDGYEKATEITERDAFRNFFARRATARRAMASAVRDEIVKLGGTPDDDGTILASAHRAFMDLRAAVQENDEAAVKAVDTGEEYLRTKFERAVEREELSGAHKALLREYLGELRADGRLVDHLEDAAS
jgi:uncharacterized protein (TIGR02284 family)